MIRDNSLALQSVTDSIEEVDLDYQFLLDDEYDCVYIKFDGFSSNIQMKQFARYMQTQLPLLFPNPTKH